MRASGWRPWSWKSGWTECSVLCAGSQSSPHARKWSSLWRKPLVSSKPLTAIWETVCAHLLYSQVVLSKYLTWKEYEQLKWTIIGYIMRNPQVHKKVLENPNGQSISWQRPLQRRVERTLWNPSGSCAEKLQLKRRKWYFVQHKSPWGFSAMWFGSNIGEAGCQTYRRW